MKAFSFIVLLLHRQIFFPFHASVVEEACESMARSNPNVNYEFCVTSLESVPESESADLQGLAIIAANLCVANATSTVSKIKELLEVQDLDPRVKRCLEDCSFLYSVAIHQLGDAIDYIEAMKIVDARVQLSAVLEAPETCKRGFEELEVASPLTRENNNLTGLSVIALNLTTSLGGATAMGFA